MATLEEALNYARQALAAGRFAEAEPIYRQMLAAVPQVPDLWHEMGLLQLQTGRLESARECIERATTLDRSNPAYFSNLGVVFRQLKRPAEAADAFRRALSFGAQMPEWHNNLALALKDLHEEVAALAEFDAAIRLRADYAVAHFNRGNLLLEMGRITEAVVSYRRSIELNPQDSGAWCKLGVAHFDAGEMDAAQTCFERALELNPRYSEARRNRAMVWFARSDYARAWPEWEYRLQCDGFVPHPTTQPRWRGEALAGRTLLVHAEQGLGDTLQFVRYVPLVEQFGGSVRLHVQPVLEPLLRQSGFERWLIAPEEEAACDLQCPLLSLPGYLPNHGAPPYWGGSYLSPDSALMSEWAPRINQYSGVRVGIAWAGNPDHPHDRFRSVPLEQFKSLAAISGVRLFSLQKGVARHQIESLSDAIDVVDLGPELDEAAGAFVDTAAVMQHLDLVIAVDTSIVHLAGGLGVNAWLPLQRSPDWRWSLEGNRSAWYPSLRLFRQTTFNDWGPVFDEMAKSLSELASSRSPC